MMEGRLAESLESFDIAIVNDGEAVEPRLNRAIVLIRMGEFADAGAELEAAWKFEGTSPLLRSRIAYHRALAADREGKLEMASEWLDRARSADPDAPDPILYSGVVLERRQKFEEAGKHYKRYLELHPESLVAMLRFGISAHRAGYRDLARRYLREVSARSPSGLEGLEARKFLIMWD